MGMLEELVDSAREGAARRSAAVPLEELAKQLASRPEQRPFREALVRPGLSLIAEFKRRSPSAGEIKDGATPAEIARSYEQGGAAALSVLTDEAHFGGSLEDLREARGACALPVLQKDFIVDRYQLYEAAAAGADAVLLIVAALEDDELARLHDEARGLDVDCIVEVHNEEELERALAVDGDVLGINNRDLEDFSVEVQTTFELMPDVPAGKTVVSESGIAERAMLEELERVGVDAVLIGEALMRADDPEAKIRELTADEEQTREHFL
ncbi:MAG: indole-3-glycerol phosphate synthase TrpC [Solirubrobacterales bacterium]